MGVISLALSAIFLNMAPGIKIYKLLQMNLSTNGNVLMNFLENYSKVSSLNYTTSQLLIDTNVSL